MNLPRRGERACKLACGSSAAGDCGGDGGGGRRHRAGGGGIPSLHSGIRRPGGVDAVGDADVAVGDGGGSEGAAAAGLEMQTQKCLPRRLRAKKT